jgi:hypothetical protein
LNTQSNVMYRQQKDSIGIFVFHFYGELNLWAVCKPANFKVLLFDN